MKTTYVIHDIQEVPANERGGVTVLVFLWEYSKRWFWWGGDIGKSWVVMGFGSTWFRISHFDSFDYPHAGERVSPKKHLPLVQFLWQSVARWQLRRIGLHPRGGPRRLSPFVERGEAPFPGSGVWPTGS